MNKVFLATRKFLSDEEGVTAIEYGLIAALIAIAVIVTVAAIGTQLNAVFARIQACLATPTAAGCAAGT